MSQPDISMNEADVAALERILAVEPVWRGIATAGDVIRFPPQTILHAGPPISLHSIARPILNSAIMAAQLEGWADSSVAAEAKILQGEIKLRPAQDYRTMVPLAAVASPSMAVQVIVDRNNPSNTTFGPLNGGMKYAQRLGLAGPEVLSHLRWINGNLASMLSIAADRDVSLIDIADAAIAKGDDCHSRTGEATKLLVQALAPRLGDDTPERQFLEEAPGFFLNIWMAAIKCMALAGEGAGSSLVTAFGSNGHEAGFQIGAKPGHWITTQAEPPVGVLNDGFKDDDRLGAIGDSALVDAFGFGAMLACSQNTSDPASRLMARAHPGFPISKVRVGLPARAALASGATPSIVLGILDRKGKAGRIGGGIYKPPASLFSPAHEMMTS